MHTRHAYVILAICFPISVLAQQVINLPAGSTPSPGGYPPGTTVIIGGVVWQAGALQQQIGSPGAESARGVSGNSDDQRGRPNFSGKGKPGGGLFNVQGDGVGLPAGVGDHATKPASQGKDGDSQRRKVATESCTGVDAQGQACGAPGSSSATVVQGAPPPAESDPGKVRPTDMRIQDTGVATPKCFADSRDSATCK